MHVPRMVRSDSIDSIEMEKTLMDEEKDEDTAQVIIFQKTQKITEILGYRY